MVNVYETPKTRTSGTPRTTKIKSKYKRVSMREDKQFAARRSLFAQRPRVTPRLSVGFPAGYAGAKTATTSLNDEFALTSTITYDTDSLYVADISQLAAGVNRNERLRDVIMCHGINIDLTCLNITTNDNLVLHYAVVAPKNSNAVSSSDFFRGYNEDRGRDFTANTLSGMDFLCNPINTDKFTVFTHRKVALHAVNGASGGTAFEDSTISSMQYRKTWISLKRQLRYGDANECETPLILLWYCSYPQKAKTAGPITDAYRLTYRAVMTFSEPKN